MKKILIPLVSAFLFSSFFVSHISAESIIPDGVQHVDSNFVTVDINEDSSVTVVETIRYNYADKTETGFTRYLPLVYQDLEGKKISVSISDLSINNENGKPYVFKQSEIYSPDKKKKYLALEIGDMNYPVSGIPTYIISYKVNGAIKFLSDHDELLWDTTGDKWPVYVKDPEVKINLPQKIDREKVTRDCFIGLKIATIKCIDRIENRKDPDAFYSYKGVVSGESMTTVIGFPKDIVQNAKEKQVISSILKTNRRISVGLVSLAVLFIIAVIMVIIYFRKITEFLLSFWKKASTSFVLKMKEIKEAHDRRMENKSKKWRIAVSIILAVILISGGVIFWKVGNIINKISSKGESVGSVVHAGLDTGGSVKGEDDGQINVLLMGILGANHPGGGLNTDTIMVASLRPKENKLSLVSIPRDLWVTDPGKNTKSKINAVYAYGEEKGSGQGIEDMKNLVSEITGLPIHYGAVISTKGFSQLVDTLGGVEVDLPEPFEESAQFTDIKVCDGETYTIPTGEFQYKKDKKKRVVAEYPLCKNKSPECGGDFKLPAGKNTLSGEQTLCFVRSRYLTSDFERARRQQLIIQQIKEKATQIGFMDFTKINSILDNLGDNVRTDAQLWEMRRMFEIYKEMGELKIYQKVLEDSKEGLLYSPEKTVETGFILLPRGDNYDKIKELFQNIFNKKKS